MNDQIYVHGRLMNTESGIIRQYSAPLAIEYRKHRVELIKTAARSDIVSLTGLCGTPFTPLSDGLDYNFPIIGIMYQDFSI